MIKLTSIYLISILALFTFHKDKVKINPNFQMQQFGDVILIHLTKDIYINWSNKTYDVVDDSLSNAIKLNFLDKRKTLIDLILNDTKTPAKACYKDMNLAIGDIAILLINKSEHLPFYKVFQIQFDVLVCKYPFGLFEYFERNRKEAKNKVELYLYNLKKG
jgi:hypothetical protein